MKKKSNHNTQKISKYAQKHARMINYLAKEDSIELNHFEKMAKKLIAKGL